MGLSWYSPMTEQCFKKTRRPALGITILLSKNYTSPYISNSSFFVKLCIDEQRGASRLQLQIRIFTEAIFSLNVPTYLCTHMQCNFERKANIRLTAGTYDLLRSSTTTRPFKLNSMHDMYYNNWSCMCLESIIFRCM